MALEPMSYAHIMRVVDLWLEAGVVQKLKSVLSNHFCGKRGRYAYLMLWLDL